MSQIPEKHQNQQRVRLFLSISRLPVCDSHLQTNQSINQFLRRLLTEEEMVYLLVLFPHLLL